MAFRNFGSLLSLFVLEKSNKLSPSRNIATRPGYLSPPRFINVLSPLPDMPACWVQKVVDAEYWIQKQVNSWKMKAILFMQLPQVATFFTPSL